MRIILSISSQKETILSNFYRFDSWSWWKDGIVCYYIIFTWHVKVAKKILFQDEEHTGTKWASKLIFNGINMNKFWKIHKRIKSTIMSILPVRKPCLITNPFFFVFLFFYHKTKNEQEFQFLSRKLTSPILFDTFNMSFPLWAYSRIHQYYSFRTRYSRMDQVKFV